MNYEIVGGNLPAVLIRLEPGEVVTCESGSMSWMDSGIEMQTEGGGVGKMFGRMFTGESLMLNKYVAHQAGEIAFASSFPGSIRAIEVTPDKPVVAQKGSFLCSVGNIEMKVHFQKKVGGALFGGEGIIMQRFEGNGLVFFEIDGSAVEYDLQPGEVKTVDTGYLAVMDASVGYDIVMIKGLKNMVFGGEGIFNTTLTGPGHIVLQTMPISGTALKLYQYMPHPSN